MISFSEICETTQGVQVSKNQHSSEKLDNYERYLYISDLVHNKDLKYIKNNFPQKIVTERDLIIANTGSPGRVFLGKKGILSNNLFRLTINRDRADKMYLFYILSSAIFQRSLQKQMKGGIQKHLGHKTMGKQKIPLPPIEEQKKIAAILDAADAYRQKTKALIGKYNELSQSLFLDMFGDPVTNPMGWEKVKLGETCDFENGDRSSNYPSGNEIKKEGKLFLSSGDIKSGNFIVKDSKFISEEKFRSLRRGKCYKGDVLMTLRGNGTGKSAVFDCEYEDGFINAQMVILRPKNRLNSKYLTLQLNCPQIYKRLINLNSGSAQPQLSASVLKKFEVFVPPIHLQNKFTQRIEGIEKQKAQAEESFVKAEDLFASLLQRAFKGEL